MWKVFSLCQAIDNNPCKYNGGNRIPGYAYWIPVLDNHTDVAKPDLLEIIDALNNYWIDNKTQSVVVDFLLFNPYVDLYTYFKVTLEFTEVGTVESKLYFGHLEKRYYKVHGINMFRAICEVIFVMFLILCIVQQLFLIYWDYKKVKSDLEEETTTIEKYKRMLSEEDEIDLKDAVVEC
jgi:cbb3-type cytochrome oxidase subunit 3